MWSFSSGSMNTVMKNNKAILRKKVSLFKSKKEYLKSKSIYDSITDEFFDYKTASPELLEEIRQKFKQKKRNEYTINVIIGFIVFASTTFFILYVFTNVFYNQDKTNATINSTTLNLQKKVEFYIKDGDDWLDQGHFENAIFQYKKASEIAPKNFSIQYRICLGYSYLCRYEQKKCEKGKELLEKTIGNFPDEGDLLALKKYYELKRPN